MVPYMHEMFVAKKSWVRFGVFCLKKTWQMAKAWEILPFGKPFDIFAAPKPMAWRSGSIWLATAVLWHMVS